MDAIFRMLLPNLLEIIISHLMKRSQAIIDCRGHVDSPDVIDRQMRI